MTRRTLCAALLAAAIACRSGVPSPARLEAGTVACSTCRMIVSDVRFAAQIVAPGEEPLFFDDLGCLASHVRRARPGGTAVVYVADHRTGEWVLARRAIYTRTRDMATPMSGGVIAHGDASSRDHDPAAREGTDVRAFELFGGSIENGP